MGMFSSSEFIIVAEHSEKIQIISLLKFGFIHATNEKLKNLFQMQLNSKILCGIVVDIGRGYLKFWVNT